MPQVLLLSTVYQLLQSMYPSMKLGDVEGLLNCMHSMYDKSHRVLQAALFEDPPKPIDEEALHMELEAMGYYLQVLFSLFAKIEPGLTPPKKGEMPPLGSDEHVLLVASAAEYRLVSFCLHVLRDYLKLHELAMEPSVPSCSRASKSWSRRPSQAARHPSPMAARRACFCSSAVVESHPR